MNDQTTDRNAEYRAKYEALVTTLTTEARERGWGDMLVTLFRDACLPLPRVKTIEAHVRIDMPVHLGRLSDPSRGDLGTALGTSAEHLRDVHLVTLVRRHEVTLTVPDDVAWFDGDECQCAKRGEPYSSGKRSLPAGWLREALIGAVQADAEAKGLGMTGWQGYENDVVLSCQYCA